MNIFNHSLLTIRIQQAKQIYR